jgi:large subunit ribosomal protein L14e
MIDIGRVCVKIAGRDAGKRCVVVDVLDENYVLVDGETRRRKCNILHLEPLDKTVEITKGASHAEVAKAAAALGWTSVEPKTRQAKPRPRKARRSKLAAAQPAAPVPGQRAPAEATPAAKKAAKPRAAKKPAAKPSAPASKE